jgi:hypothetical protein
MITKKVVALMACTVGLIVLSACSTPDPKSEWAYLDMTCQGYGYVPGSSLYYRCIGIEQDHFEVLGVSYGRTGPLAVERDQRLEQKRLGRAMANSAN